MSRILTIPRVRRSLYHSARLLGDLRAVERGPKAIAIRAERRLVWSVVGRLLGKVMR